MTRRNESNEEKSRRKLVESFLSENPIKDPSDIQELMKEMMRQVLEGGLTVNWMMNWVIPAMIIGTRKPRTAGTAIRRNQSKQVWTIWKLPFPETGMGSLNPN